MIKGFQTAKVNNLTIGTDLQSLVALINPLETVQLLLTSLPARSAIPNYPPGRVSDACYNDLITTFDSLLAMKKWAIDSEFVTWHFITCLGMAVVYRDSLFIDLEASVYMYYNLFS